MQLLTRRPRARAITASATKLGPKDTAYTQRLNQPWQFRALDYCDTIGELRFSSLFYAQMMSRVRYYPARLNDDGSTTPITSGLPVDLLNKIQDPGGGRSRIQYDYGRLMFITGEGCLFVSGENTPAEKWRFLWREELKLTDTGEAIRLNFQRQETNERGTAYRMWTPSARQSDLADAPMRAVLDIAEELLILTASVRGTATSRLTRGILLMASQLSPDPVEPGADDDATQNILLNDMIEHMQAQIENPGSAASMMPFLWEGDFDYIREGAKWLQLHDPATDYMERDLRTEAIRRLALSLDFPPEFLLGMTDANHWTAAAVQMDMWRQHGVNVAERFADDISEAYLRPGLLEAGVSEDEVAHTVVALDDSKVVVNPNRGEDADSAADRGMISDEGYRKLKGIDESMAPSEEEKRIFFLTKTRDTMGLEEALGLQPKAGPTPGPESNRNGTAPPAPTQGRVTSRQEARVAALMGAAQLAVRQCRARAGTMIRTQLADKCPDCRERTAQVPHSLVASAIGAEEMERIGIIDRAALVKGGSSEFGGLLADYGVAADDRRVLCSRVELLAAHSLFEREQPELPPGFAALVEHALEVSDGLPAEAAA